MGFGLAARAEGYKAFKQQALTYYRRVRQSSGRKRGMPQRAGILIQLP